MSSMASLVDLFGVGVAEFIVNDEGLLSGFTCCENTIGDVTSVAEAGEGLGFVVRVLASPYWSPKFAEQLEDLLAVT